jgi:photosystem II stability/assembly factor-like uncharacterized protein
MLKKILLLSFSLIITSTSGATAAAINDLSHIHNIKVLGKQIFFGTHEGLYHYKSKNDITAVGQDRFDIMGLNISRNTLFASGHPGINSQLPQPVGLLKSTDGGKNWKKVSLQGKVDFHLLEVSNKEIYGGDSGSGTLFYSKDQGKNWSDQGKNTFSDIAPNPRVTGSALAIRAGVIHQSSDVFKTTQVLPFKNKVTSIDWNNKRLLATSGAELLISKDMGKSWKVLFSFSENIAVLAQSRELIVIAAGSTIFTSSDNGKSFQTK